MKITFFGSQRCYLPKAVIKAGFHGPTYYEGRELKNIDQGILRPYSLFQVVTSLPIFVSLN